MSSFYGQVLYEFTRMFSRLNVHSNEVNETPITPPSKVVEVALNADSNWEQLHFSPSNRWIQLDTKEVNGGEKMMTIGHSTAGAVKDEYNSISFQKVDTPEGVEPTRLLGGDTIEVITNQYDNAGHLVKEPEKTYYKLPQTTIIVNEGEGAIEISPKEDGDVLPLKFAADDRWINLDTADQTIKFSHGLQIKGAEGVESFDYGSLEALGGETYPIAEVNTQQHINSLTIENEKNKMSEQAVVAGNPETITLLSSGDLIKTHSFTQDSTGHIISIEPKYFRLPMSPTDKSFEEYGDRITSIETRLASGKIEGTDPEITYGNYEDIVEQVLDTQKFLEPISAYDTINTLTGKLDNMYSLKDEEDKLKEARSIAETIGNVDGSKNSIRTVINQLKDETDTDDDPNIYTIAEAFVEMGKKISDLNSLINISTLAIDNLKSRVEDLEKK